MREFGIALVFIFSVLGLVWAYLLAWHGRRLTIRRAASEIVAIVAASIASVGTLAYAIPGLGDFHNPEFPSEQQ